MTRRSSPPIPKGAPGVYRIDCPTTREDDEAAKVAFNGQHAFVKFDVPGMSPLFMVQSGVVWKIDVPIYVITLGNQLQATSQYCNKTSALYANFANAIAAGKYQNAQDFLNDFKKASDALDTAQ